MTLFLSACGGGGGSSGPPPNSPPTASFDTTPTSGEAPLTVNFDAGDSRDSDGDITSYEWDFGNGTTATGATAQTTYEVAGDFNATLEVTDDDGASDSTTKTITVTETTFSVSGSIRILSGSEVDVDTNDSNTEAGDNNGFDTAQPIGNPTSIGGYVTEVGEGEPGLVSVEGDVSDFYQFTSVGNETLVLTIGDASLNDDLDLRLYDEERQLVKESSGLERTESFNVTEPGNYFVEVTAFSGASTYVLAVGQNQTTTHKSLRLSSSFVPGEIVLGPPRKNQNATGELKGRASGLKTLSPANWGNGPRLVGLPATSHRVDRLGALGAQPRRIPGAALSDDKLERLDTIHAIKLLRREGRYKYVEPNYIRRPSRIPNDRLFDRQWHYGNIKLEQAWELTTGSSDVVVGVIDTGVLLQHPDLSPRLTDDGFDFISDPERSLDGDGIDPDPNDPGDLELGDRSTFHGTHVAGTVAAHTDNNETGVAGVGWNTRIMPLRVLGRGGGTSADIIQAIRYAAGLSNDSNTVPNSAVDIINLSLGGGAFSQAEQDAIDHARAEGVIVIAAAGNDSRDTVTFPAGYNGVVGVSATTITNDLAFYSNTGAGVDVTAPGGDTSTDINGDGVADGVISTLGDDSGDASEPEFIYSPLAGTSMAAPHVSGVAALMRAEASELTPDQFNALLATGDITDDLGEPGRDNQFGHGLINAQKAVAAAGNGTLEAFVVASPSTLNFGAVAERLELDVDNAGTEDATVNDVRSDQSWLTVNPIDLNATGAGIYQVNVERGNLGDGIFRGNIVIETSANNLSVPVVMRVSSLDVDADAGFHYIVLLDESGETVNQDTAVAIDGRYTFQFDQVEPGSYRVAAGSNTDNDGFICDAGEACGFYRTLDSPTTIEIEGDLSGLEFVTGFRASLSSSAAQAEGEPDAAAIEPVRIRPPRPKEVEQ